MIEWSTLFETNIELVDQQHKTLFEMLNRTASEIDAGKMSSEHLQKSFDDLLAYANQHFVDEEMLMAKYHVDQRHTSIQRMEHHAFIYDVGRLRGNFVDEAELEEQFEKLMKFVASWLVYHTLRTDQVLGMQIAEIKKGASPQKAYDIAISTPLSPAINLKVLDAVLHLWADAAERSNDLAEQLDRLQGK